MWEAEAGLDEFSGVVFVKVRRTDSLEKGGERGP